MTNMEASIFKKEQFEPTHTQNQPVTVLEVSICLFHIVCLPPKSSRSRCWIGAAPWSTLRVKDLSHRADTKFLSLSFQYLSVKTHSQSYPSRSNDITDLIWKCLGWYQDFLIKVCCKKATHTVFLKRFIYLSF